MGAKILLLTENPENMAKIEMALGVHQHEITPTTRFAQAFDALDEDSTIDMIICDAKLSWGDSFDLLKKVRADHLLSSLPFIFLCTSQAELTTTFKAAAAIYGPDKFLFMDEFEPHRFRYEVEALLPEQIVGTPDVELQTDELPRFVPPPVEGPGEENPESL